MRISAASPAARRLGYVNELAAIDARHRRCRASWGTHAQQSRSALLTSAQRYRTASGAALVLGSGALVDIPLSELVDLFGYVYLADIAFLASTRRAAARFGRRVSLIHTDLTGVSLRLDNEPGIPEPASAVHGLPAEFVADVAWVASVNCLTQLPLLPARHLLKRGCSGDAVEAFGLALLRAHLEALVSLRSSWCLLSEYQDYRFDRSGVVVEQTDYAEVMAPVLTQMSAQRFAEWDWWVHPPGELPHGETELRRVAAWQSRS